jgi:hypothetical protein
MTQDDIIRMAVTCQLITTANRDGIYMKALERFAELVRADEREAIYDKWHSCVMSDLENGVKFLNEKAATEWQKNYPAQSKTFPEWIEARGQA